MWDPIIEAIVTATVKWIEPLMAAIFGTAILWIGWLGKRALLKKGAQDAALDAEKELGSSPGLGPRKKELAMENLRKTMGGRLSTRAAIGDAIEDHGMPAVKQSSSRPPPAN